MEIIHEEFYIVTTCPFCGCSNQIQVNAIDYLNWDWGHGMKTQDAFPYLSANEREMLISGICPDCWDKLFAE